MDYKWNQKTGVSLMVILALVLVGIGSVVLSPLTVADARRATIYVSIGKVVAIQTHVARRGIMDVKSNRTGDVYRFYLGNRLPIIPIGTPLLVRPSRSTTTMTGDI